MMYIIVLFNPATLTSICHVDDDLALYQTSSFQEASDEALRARATYPWAETRIIGQR